MIPVSSPIRGPKDPLDSDRTLSAGAHIDTIICIILQQVWTHASGYYVSGIIDGSG
jgi:hypothetical protein